MCVWGGGATSDAAVGPFQKLHMGSVTCATILVRAVHTAKAEQTATSVHKCRHGSRETSRRKHTLLSLLPPPVQRAAFTAAFTDCSELKAFYLHHLPSAVISCLSCKTTHTFQQTNKPQKEQSWFQIPPPPSPTHTPVGPTSVEVKGVLLVLRKVMKWIVIFH